MSLQTRIEANLSKQAPVSLMVWEQNTVGVFRHEASCSLVKLLSGLIELEFARGKR